MHVSTTDLQIARSRSIRAARLDEADLFSGIAKRAIGSWGYEPEFMAWADQVLTFTPEFISTHPTFVLDEDGEAIGFYSLRGEPPDIDLRAIMVDPRFKRTGAGSQMWHHAVAQARQRGASALIVDSDPYAVPFYLAMGAVIVGERDWAPPTRPNWGVKMMRLEL
jgi:GNAT superfamily N-acetyltransferase